MICNVTVVNDSFTFKCTYTVWKVSIYGVSSGPYFPVFSPNMGKYGPKKTPSLDTFYAVGFWKFIEMIDATFEKCVVLYQENVSQIKDKRITNRGASTNPILRWSALQQ